MNTNVINGDKVINATNGRVDIGSGGDGDVITKGRRGDVSGEKKGKRGKRLEGVGR